MAGMFYDNDAFDAELEKGDKLLYEFYDMGFRKPRATSPTAPASPIPERSAMSII